MSSRQCDHISDRPSRNPPSGRSPITARPPPSLRKVQIPRPSTNRSQAKGPLIRTGTAKGWIPLACGADENLRHDCKQKRYETRGSPLHALLRPPALQPSSSAATCHRQPSNPWVEPPSPPPGPGPPQQRPNTSHGAASQNSGASSVLTRPARFVALYECINSTSDVAELDLTRSTCIGSGRREGQSHTPPSPPGKGGPCRPAGHWRVVRLRGLCVPEGHAAQS